MLKERSQTDPGGSSGAARAAATSAPLPSNKGRGRGGRAAKAKSSSKSSADPGAGAGSGGSDRKGLKGDGDAALNDLACWSPMATPLVGEPGDVTRHKTCLDDFMYIFYGLVGSSKIDQDDGSRTNQAIMSLFRHSASIFLEFVFSGSAAINGKFAKAYSVFRAELITFLSTALEIAGKSAAGKISARLADFMTHEHEATAFGVGPVQDESDEVRTMERIRMACNVLEMHAHFKNYIAEVLPLPLEFHAKFCTAI